MNFDVEAQSVYFSFSVEAGMYFQFLKNSMNLLSKFQFLESKVAIIITLVLPDIEL